MNRERDPLPIAAAAGLLACLCAWVAFERWQFLSSSPHPWGIDGYFYSIQVRSLIESGTLHYPSAPMTFWLMAPLALIGGEIWAVKVVAAAASALVAVPMYGVARELGADRAPALVASAVAATAPASFYFSVEFVKNGVGVTIFAFALWALLAARRSPSTRRIAVAIALAAACWLTHKTAAGLLAVCGAPLLLPLLSTARRRTAAAAVAAVALLGAAFLPDRFLGVADAGLLSDLASGEFAWRLPVLDYGGGKAIYFGHMVPLALLACVVYWAAYAKRRDEGVAPRVLGAATTLSVIAAFPLLDVGDPNSFGFRFRLLGYVFVAVAIGPALSRLLSAATPLTRSGICLAIAGFVVAARPSTYEAPVVQQHPALVDAVTNAKNVLPEGHGIVTPERRIAFMATWTTRAPATQDQTAFDADKRWRLIPMPYMSPGLRRAIRDEKARSPGGIHYLHSMAELGLVLIHEPAWDAILERLSERDRERYRAWPVY